MKLNTILLLLVLVVGAVAGVYYFALLPQATETACQQAGGTYDAAEKKCVFPAPPAPEEEKPATTLVPADIQAHIDSKKDLIVLESPEAGAAISSPLVIKGEARGNWFFEASFPVVLTDWDGLIIAQGVAQAEGDWMTTDFVPFTATLTFTKPAFGGGNGNTGTLILQKDNPSGLPQNDDALEIPVRFE